VRIRTPPPSKQYKDNYDAIFRKEKRPPEGADVGQDPRAEPGEHQEDREQGKQEGSQA